MFPTYMSVTNGFEPILVGFEAILWGFEVILDDMEKETRGEWSLFVYLIKFDVLLLFGQFLVLSLNPQSICRFHFDLYINYKQLENIELHISHCRCS